MNDVIRHVVIDSNGRQTVRQLELTDEEQAAKDRREALAAFLADDSPSFAEVVAAMKNVIRQMGPGG